MKRNSTPKKKNRVTINTTPVRRFITGDEQSNRDRQAYHPFREIRLHTNKPGEERNVYHLAEDNVTYYHDCENVNIDRYPCVMKNVLYYSKEEVDQLFDELDRMARETKQLHRNKRRFDNVIKDLKHTVRNKQYHKQKKAEYASANQYRRTHKLI